MGRQFRSLRDRIPARSHFCKGVLRLRRIFGFFGQKMVKIFGFGIDFGHFWSKFGQNQLKLVLVRFRLNPEPKVKSFAFYLG